MRQTVVARVSWIGILLVASVFLAVPVSAQEGPSSTEDRLRRLEETVRRLEAELARNGRAKGATSQPAPTPQDTAQGEKEIHGQAKKEPEKKASEQLPHEESGYVVGSDLGVKGRWREGLGLEFESAHKDFRLHLGGRFHYIHHHSQTCPRPCLLH